MYIAQAYTTLHEWWRYLIGFFIIILAWQFIGMIPLGIALGFKTLSTGAVPEGIPDMINLLGSNMFLFLMLLSFAVGLGGVVFTAKILHKQSFISLTTARKKIDWKRFWFIFFVWGIISSGFVLVDYYLSPEDFELNFQLKPFLILCVIAILLVPLQTSFEEYLFRGYLMQGIGVSTIEKKFPIVLIYIIISIIGVLYLNGIYNLSIIINSGIILMLFVVLTLILNSGFVDNLIESSSYMKLYETLMRKSTPLIITSVSFGLMHLANPEVEKLGYVIMIYYIGTGLFLGILTLMDEGLELSLGFHAANNLFTALLVTADWTAFQTHSILKDLSNPSEMGLMEIFIPVFVVFPILLLFLSKKYKWTNWNEKLFGKVIEPSIKD